MKAAKFCSYPFYAFEPLGEMAQRIPLRHAYIYIVGYIRYADINDVERFMGFCRVNKLPNGMNGDGRFIPVDDPDYEYQD